MVEIILLINEQADDEATTIVCNIGGCIYTVVLNLNENASESINHRMERVILSNPAA